MRAKPEKPETYYIISKVNKTSRSASVVYKTMTGKWTKDIELAYPYFNKEIALSISKNRALLNEITKVLKVEVTKTYRTTPLKRTKI